MPCEDCARLARRIEELEAKLAEVIGIRMERKGPTPPNGTPRPGAAVRPGSALAPAVPRAMASAPKAAAVAPRAEPEPLPSKAAALATPEPPPVSEATANLPPAKPVTAVETEKLAALGIPVMEHADAVRALQEYPRGLEIVAPMIGKQVPGAAIFHAAYSAEKYGKDAFDAVMGRIYASAGLEPADIPHTTEAVRAHGPENAEYAVRIGYRRLDIVFAAEVIKMWPRPSMGRDALQRMQKLFTRVRVDIVGEDLRYCAMAYINLGEELLERAIRDRHPKNEREPWLRGISIPLVAWAYRMSAPHTGPAIDECRTKGVRRDRVGHEVLAGLSRRFGRKVGLPPWLGGGKNE